MSKFAKSWIRIVWVYMLSLVFISGIFYFAIPELLCYPPDSTDNEFQVLVNDLTYTQQFIGILVLVLIVAYMLLLINYIRVKKTRKKLLDQKVSGSINSKDYYSLAQMVLKIPKHIAIAEILVPILMVIASFSLMDSSIDGKLFVTIKVTMLFFSLLALTATLAYIFSKNMFSQMLIGIHGEIIDKADIGDDFKKHVDRTSIMNVILIITIPLFTISGFVTAFVAYSEFTLETGDLNYSLYNGELEELEISKSADEPVLYLEEKLSDVEMQHDQDTYFIINPEGEVITGNGSSITTFFIEYLHLVAPTQVGYENRTYDFYGIDTQGVTRTVDINGEEWVIGIKYMLQSTNALMSILVTFFGLFVINLTLIIYFSKYISNDIKRISTQLSKLYTDSSKVHDIYKLPIISNDEIGDLAHDFNKIQQLTKQNIDKIYSSQETLMEKERLASLGQLIGGIAHNLKTPIMSISGAAEGIRDLVDEYKSSVEDEEVTPEDHYEIADEIIEWIEKVKSHAEYMSDVITAVKGQAVSFNNTEIMSFTIDELLKRIEILMKHELKYSRMYLNTELKVDAKMVVEGDVNTLIQIINNLISNSIQAYGDRIEETIDMIVETDEQGNLMISIRDYGPGLPKKVQEKLFKEMITTKGKKGTGLGLYMSYSTIKAHFNGDMVADTSDKGTTFKIIIPVEIKEK